MDARFLNTAIFMHDQSTIGAKAGEGRCSMLGDPPLKITESRGPPKSRKRIKPRKRIKRETRYKAGPMQDQCLRRCTHLKPIPSAVQ